MTVYCDRCKKRANVYTLIGTFQYCDKCVGLVRHAVRNLLVRFNDRPTLIQNKLRELYTLIDRSDKQKSK